MLISDIKLLNSIFKNLVWKKSLKFIVIMFVILMLLSLSLLFMDNGTGIEFVSFYIVIMINAIFTSFFMLFMPLDSSKFFMNSPIRKRLMTKIIPNFCIFFAALTSLVFIILNFVIKNYESYMFTGILLLSLWLISTPISYRLNYFIVIFLMGGASSFAVILGGTAFKNLGTAALIFISVAIFVVCAAISKLLYIKLDKRPLLPISYKRIAKW